MINNCAQDAHKIPFLQGARLLAVIGRPGNYYCMVVDRGVQPPANEYLKGWYSLQPDAIEDPEIYLVSFENWFKAKEVYMISDLTPGSVLDPGSAPIPIDGDHKNGNPHYGVII